MNSKTVLMTAMMAASMALSVAAAPLTSAQVASEGYLVFGQVIPSHQREIVKHAGLQVIHADGAVTLRLKETGREEKMEGAAKHVVITCQDEVRPFRVVRHILSWPDCGAVETWVEVSHSEKGPVKLLRADSFAAPVKASAKTVRVMSLTGVWAKEANVSEAPVGNGQIVELSSKAGTRSAWESNAAMMVSFGEKVNEEEGRVLGVALEWTGSTCRRVRRAWDGSTTEVFAGVDMTTGPYTLDAGKTFTTPKAILVWSEQGKGEVSRQLHRWARNHCLPHGRDLHPILLNSWEGSYFSFTEKTLTDMMDGVKQMGGEMFVLDDGWFGKGKYARDNVHRDKVGLGDWYVNTEKLPHGLGWLANEANRRGLQFGIWVEPEMVNTASWLAEEHPEWILREEGRPLALGRGGSQVVLDYTNPAVRARIYDMLDKVYASMPTLAFIKWDSNQNIVNPGSTYLPADRQPNLWYDYTVGLYDLLAKLESKRPNIMTQACASGGGHMDYGFLRYADEFWASDRTDALDRIFIQWGSLQFYPACAMACHVTAVPNHHTRRVTPLKYRFDVAMVGRLGFELHPKDLKPEEIAFAQAAVADYKKIRPIVQQGDLYRLASPYENSYASLMYVDEKKDAAVLFALGLDVDGQRTAKLCPRGLDAARTYCVTEINCGTRLHSTVDGKSFTGAELMKNGLAITLDGKYDSASFTLKAR
ncbi:MAG: alpha-galactosidase [Kiritimatiellae bacterium]|nr:alpha-galactosidase [Kiritimatiellia bacterium]